MEREFTIVYYVIQTKCVGNADSSNEQHVPLPSPEATLLCCLLSDMRETEL